MNTPVVISPVVSKREQRCFQRLPWAIYAPPGTQRDLNWVPPTLSQERDLLGWRKWCGWGRPHPFYDHAECRAYLAWRGKTALGRLAVIVNDVHNRTYADHLGFFGFFECVDDASVAHALLKTGENWLRERGMTSVRGPVNPSLNYTCGVLVEGFERPPCFLMTYNPPYYSALLEGCGYSKAQDLYAYEMDLTLLADLVARYKPAVVAALERTDLVVRPMDPARFQEEIETYLDIYNRGLAGSWGFTPLQPREIRKIAADLRHIIVSEFAVFAEVAGKPVGALLALLDYNEILRTLNGRLLPPGMLALWRGRTGRRRITRARAMAMTMVPGYQSAGLSVILLDHLVGAVEGARAGRKWGIERYEFSWVLESNARSRGTIERTGARRTNTYRLYDKML